MQHNVAPQVPEIDGDFFVYPDGRRLLRVRGAEGEEGAAGEETPGGQGASGEPGTRTDADPPEGGEVNWEERYRNLEGNHTRASQRASELERQLEAAQEVFTALQDPETQAEVLKHFGLTLGDTQPGGGQEEDPEEALQRRIEALEQGNQQREATDEQQSAMRDFNAHLDELAGTDHKLSDDDRLLIYVKSTQQGFTPEATEAAFNALVEAHEAYDKSVIEAYAKSKKGPRPPLPGGTGATEAPNLDNRQDRVAWMVAEAQRRAEAEAEPPS